MTDARLDEAQERMVELVTSMKEVIDLLREQSEIMRGWNQR